VVAARQQRRADIVQATRNASSLHGAAANGLQDARVPTVEIQPPQPIPQRPHVNAEFVGDPQERPAPLDHPVGQVALKSCKPSWAARTVRRWSVARRRCLAVITRWGGLLMPASASSRRRTGMVVPSSLAICGRLASC
jgi:hypothetical protein